MKAEIISVGTELLLGHIIDSNSSVIANLSREYGIDVYRHQTVGDNITRLKTAIHNASKKNDLVFICGGLGPTIDDITFEAIAKTIKRPLVLNKLVKKHIEDYVKRQNLRLKVKDPYKSALLPKGVLTFLNHIGTAPGIFIKYNNTYIIALPGPPHELEPLLKNQIMPYLKKRFNLSNIIYSETLKTFGLSEPFINDLAGDILSAKGRVKAGIYVNAGEVWLRIMTKASSKAEAKKLSSPIVKRLKQSLSPYLFGQGEDTLESVCVKLLRKKNLSLSIAESCTGGLIAEKITRIPGASKIFQMSATTYSNGSKVNFLSVPRQLIKKYGVVSQEVACAMAKNIRRLSKTDLGIAVTGIAGPSGSTKKKPVGLVYIALSKKTKTTFLKLNLSGTRLLIREKTSKFALNALRKELS